MAIWQRYLAEGAQIHGEHSCFEFTSAIVNRVFATFSSRLRFGGVGAFTGGATHRRVRRLMRFGVHALLARRDGLAYTHLVWASIAALAYLLTQIADLGWLIAPTFLLYCALSVITLFDARYFIIPDIMVTFLAVCGVVVFLTIDLNGMFIHAAAAIFAYAALRMIAFLYYYFRGEAGLGPGDAKLFGVAGLWLGFDGLPTCLILAVVSALASAAIIHRDTANKSARLAIPFGPHLALGLWLVWAFGPLEHG